MKYDGAYVIGLVDNVAPFAGVWIEIPILLYLSSVHGVAPFAGVWIEIVLQGVMLSMLKSHPSRVCGLKYPPAKAGGLLAVVAPFAGVWIEIIVDGFLTPFMEKVAPFAGVWIEIFKCLKSQTRRMSHPSRVCGLKFKSRGIHLSTFWSHPSRVCGLKLYA